MSHDPDDSPIIGSRRHGRVCVAAFVPPDSVDRYEAWREAIGDRHGPPADWQVDTGRAADGREFVMVWVPKRFADPSG